MKVAASDQRRIIARLAFSNDSEGAQPQGSGRREAEPARLAGRRERTEHARMRIAEMPQRQKQKLQLHRLRRSDGRPFHTRQDRRRPVHDGQQEDGETMAILFVPEVGEGFAFLVRQPQRVQPRAAQPDRKDAASIDLDDEGVGERVADLRRIDVRTLGRGACAPRSIPIGIEFPRDGMSHFASRAASHYIGCVGLGHEPVAIAPTSAKQQSPCQAARRIGVFAILRPRASHATELRHARSPRSVARREQ